MVVQDYGTAILQSVPPRALVLTRGDLITNTTRYLHNVEQMRPDVRLLDQEMLTFRWMTAQVRRQMPDVQLPGTHYDIANHDMAWVMKNTVEVGLNIDPDGFAEYAARCSILHITKLEDIPHPVAS